MNHLETFKIFENSNDSNPIPFEKLLGEHGNMPKRGYDIFNKNLKPIFKNSNSEFVQKMRFDGGNITPTGFVIILSSDYNYDLEIEFDFNKDKKLIRSTIKHRIKQWLYNLEDVEQIGGFQGQLDTFKEIERIVNDLVNAGSNNEKFLLNLVKKQALQFNKTEILDIAIEKGFDLEGYKNYLLYYCKRNKLQNSIKLIENK